MPLSAMPFFAPLPINNLSLVFLLILLHGGFSLVRCSESVVSTGLWKKVLEEGKSPRSNNSERWDIQSGSFIITSDISAEPKLTCYYAIPTAKNGQQSPRRDDVVYFFHTPNPKTKNILDNGICNRLVTELGMSVFGIAFKESSQSGLFYGSEESRQRFYVFSKSGSFHAILTAWSAMRRQFDFKRRDFFLYGYSAGGIGVQRFAEDFPEYCAGIVSVNGHTFTQKNHATCPVLVIHSYGDGGAPSGNGLLLYYQQIDTPCIRLMLSPSWERLKEGNDGAFHAVNGGVVELASTFIEGIADLRAQSKADKVPPISEWPYLTAQEDPLLVMKTPRAATNYRDLFGDKTPMAIPSARFYAALLARPIIPLELQTTDGTAYLMRPRVDQASRGVIFIQRPEVDLYDVKRNGYIGDSFLEGQFFSEHGFAVTISNTRSSIKELRERLLVVDTKQLSCALLGDPAPGSLRTMVNYSHLVISFTKPTIVEPYLDEFQALLKSGVRLFVLLPYQTHLEYDKALMAINPDIRNQIFPPFDTVGNNPNLSLHQQQIEATLAFLLRDQATKIK
jgi:pimeloyl-ACP methyl ester carboxylesterase/uncharacterized protein (DUF427 family)